MKSDEKSKDHLNKKGQSLEWLEAQRNVENERTKAKQKPESAVKKGVGLGFGGCLGIVIFIIIITIIGSAFGSHDNSTSTTSSSPSSTNSQSSITMPAAQSSQPKQSDVPAEYKSALNKAASYSNTMHMSKRGVYDQLVSEYGEKFSASAAQYAVDNVKADWNMNALAKAKSYQDTMNMSPASIHDQLTSENGEKFTQAEADYAIAHLND